jgi:hypothetical protein
MNFDIFYKKTLCLGKTAITFAYEVGLKSFLYEKVSTQIVTSEFNNLMVDSTNFRISKFKRENRLFRTFIFSIFFKFLFLDQNLYWIKLLD